MTQEDQIVAAMLTLFGIFAVFGLIVYVWLALALSKVFTKLHEPGWHAWVPFLNLMTLLRLGGQSVLWAFSAVVPILSVVGLVFIIVAVHAVNRRFGHGAGFTVLAVLFAPLWASILGFGSATPVAADPSRLSPPATPPMAQPAPVASQFAPPAPLEASTPAAEPAAPQPVAAEPRAVEPPAAEPVAEDAAVQVEDSTVVVPRRSRSWTIETGQGQRVPVTSECLILGRDPAADPAFPEAQLVSVDDPDRSVSKSHARLELVDGAWHLTDLHSTNGVRLTDAAGHESGEKLSVGVEVPIPVHFFMGDLRVSVRRV